MFLNNSACVFNNCYVFSEKMQCLCHETKRKDIEIKGCVQTVLRQFRCHFIQVYMCPDCLAPFSTCQALKSNSGLRYVVLTQLGVTSQAGSG